MSAKRTKVSEYESMDDDGGMAFGAGFMVIILLGCLFLLLTAEEDHRTPVERGISVVKERFR